MIKDYDINKFEQFNNSKNKEKIITFHKERTAFIILDNKVVYLKNSELSHLQWAESLGIDETTFNSLTRGYVLNNNIVFYKGNFDFDKQVINHANKFAKQILNDCLLKTAKVYAGVIIGEIGTIYLPNKHLFNL